MGRDYLPIYSRCISQNIRCKSCFWWG